MGERLRTAAAGVLAGATLGIAPVSALASVPEQAPNSTTAYDPEEYLPTFEDPMALRNGQFLGSIAFKYARPSKLRGPIEQYQRSRGIAWSPKTETVNRLVASDVRGGVDTAERHLDEGVVLSQSSQPNVLELAHHNVTPIFAPVNVRGKRFDNRYIGMNAVARPGDRMTISRPIAGGDQVRTYEYTALGRKILKPSRIDRFIDTYKPFKNTDANYAVTYSCWTPGSAEYRSLIIWRRNPENGVNTLRGTVRPVGRVKSGNGRTL